MARAVASAITAIAVPSRMGRQSVSTGAPRFTFRPMKIAVLGVGHIGSTVGRLWHAAGHDVTFAGRDAGESRDLAADLGARAHAATAS